MANVLLAKTCWANWYRGLGVGDDPRGVHGYIRVEGRKGHEAYNFRRALDGKFYGYVRTESTGFNFRRLDPSARGDRIHDFTVVWVSRPPGQVGPRVVGWYKRATLLANGNWDNGPWRHALYKDRSNPDGRCGYLCFTRVATRLDPSVRGRWELPHSIRTNWRRSDVLYPLNEKADGPAKWLTALRSILLRINRFESANKPADLGHEDLETREVSVGQGFTIDSTTRRIVEETAMVAAKRYFRRSGFRVRDVSERKSYDLECRAGSTILRVEVKGTTGEGRKVILTRKEKEFHDRGGRDKVLFVLPQISIVDGKVVRTGDCRVLRPFRLTECRVNPNQFVVELPLPK